jgi:hypothetical protein
MQYLRRVTPTLLILLVALVALAPSAYARLAFRTPHSALRTNDVTVISQDAAPHFPETVDFTLKTTGFQAARATLNYSLVGDPITAGEEADVAAPASNLSVSFTLDLSTHYIPPGTEVSYYWTLTAPSGDTVDTPANTFQMLDAGYDWNTLTDPKGRVSVHWYEGSRTFGQNLLDVATDALDRLERDINAGLDRPANIWVYATQDELISALPSNIPEWVGGKAFPSLALVLANIADDELADLETKRVVPHELSHLVLYQATLNPYNSPPAWLDEGLATHNQEAHDPSEASALKQAAEEGRLVPLKALSGSFGADEETALLSYAESRSAVDFIVDDPRFGPEKLARTVAAFKDGVTYDDALKAGIGVTTDELDALWRASLPYKVAPQSNAPQPTRPQPSTDSSWSTPLSLVALGALLALFLLGGIFLLAATFRQRRKT